MKISYEAKKAFKIGSVCFLSYLAVYVARNTLSAVSPQMIAGGAFTKEYVGTLSSLFFITYAIGQLINGAIGDKIKAKYMMSTGLLLAGVGSALFPLLANYQLAVYGAYGLTGFALSMIYGPMTKVVSENTELVYATRCSLGYTFASFFGSPFAGILAALFVWQGVFFTSSAILVVMGLVCFLVFTLFERKKIIEYGKYEKPKNQGTAGGIKVLIRHQIIKFTLISILTGVVRTTVVFWLPTYISEYLEFSPDNAALIFTVATFIISLTTFVAIFVYERLHRNMDLVILLAFSTSAVCFMVVYLFKQPILNVIFMVLAIMASNSAATMLWSRYCPSLRDTGMVSGATGFLDFVSYMAAAASSTLFANAVSVIGWGNLILVWFGLMILGVVVALPYKSFRGKMDESPK